MRRKPNPLLRDVDQLIERAYYATCSGIQIDIMDISKVFQHGRRLIEFDKVDKAGLERGIREYVETIRRN
jgi:hypothetical protein